MSKDIAINNFSSNIHLFDANRRRNAKIPECINCGATEVHVELNSCGKRTCIDLMRKVKRWSDSVLSA